jgi:lipid-binding SYLF domain-containing protein
MKKLLVNLAIKSFLAFALVSFCTASPGQTTKKEKQLAQDAKTAIEEFLHTDPMLKGIFNSSYGYVVFPSIGKGAIGIGGASGGGILYEKGAMAGKAQMTQVTVGFQLGGQAYREIIFFQDEATLEHFKQNKFEFSAQASAVAATAGASGNAKYRGGVMIFTQQKGGLMYEASIGGQKFSYTPFKK